jgi:hypothetical protein
MRIVPAQVHAVLDYVAALGLIALPWLLGFGSQGPLAVWISTGAGVGLICYSLATDYPYSAAKVIPFKVHLTLDVVAGLVFIAAPFVLGFTGLVKWYYVAQGSIVLVLVSITNASTAKQDAAK